MEENEKKLLVLDYQGIKKYKKFHNKLLLLRSGTLFSMVQLILPTLQGDTKHMDMLTQGMWNSGSDGGRGGGERAGCAVGWVGEDKAIQYNTVMGEGHGREGRCLTMNFLFCFQWLPCAFVAIWASVTIRMRSHSSWVGSSRSHTDFCSSSRRRRSRFSSISFRLASRLLSSSTTGQKETMSGRGMGRKRGT